MKKMLAILFLFPFFTRAQIITRVAGTGYLSTVSGGAYCCDGSPATLAQLNRPGDVAVDKYGNIYIADSRNERIRKINTSGIITTIAGNGSASYNGDDIPATAAQISMPMSVDVDTSGNLYFSDGGNSRVRKVSTSGIITTVASPVEVSSPYGIAVSCRGNIYIADQYSHRIQKVDASGMVSTFAGKGSVGYSGDGGDAKNAELRYPTGVAVDADESVYIVDMNHVVRKVNSWGIIYTIAGIQLPGNAGDGGPASSAQIGYPRDIVVDASGQIFISQSNNFCIRKINASGIISTITGNGTNGNSGDGGLASLATLGTVYGMGTDNSGSIYFADLSNQVIRKICCYATSINTVLIEEPRISLYPSPARTDLTITSSYAINRVDIMNLFGQTLYSQEQSTKTITVDVANLPVGIFLVKINGSVIKKFLKQ